jgi:membrane carboxypeptidase/penicillin-binding protein
MREAVVATEDERFYRHDGIDIIGVIRALPYDVVHLSLAEGASTITEQLAKVLYLGGPSAGGAAAFSSFPNSQSRVVARRS